MLSIGDKVKIKDVSAIQGYKTKENIKKWEKDVFTVSRMDWYGSSECIYYTIINYDRDEFVMLEDNIIKQFTKSDLRDGMVVEDRDGTKRIVVGNILYGLYSSCTLDYYEENFEYIVKNERKNDDIIKVYTFDKNNVVLLSSLERDSNLLKLNLIWQRQEESKYLNKWIRTKDGDIYRIDKIHTENPNSIWFDQINEDKSIKSANIRIKDMTEVGYKLYYVLDSRDFIKAKNRWFIVDKIEGDRLYYEGGIFSDEFFTEEQIQNYKTKEQMDK